MTQKLHHALTRADYQLLEDGTVRVCEGEKWGRFDGEGYWIEGEVRHCDPQMCRWLVSGPLMKKFTDAAGTPRSS